MITITTQSKHIGNSPPITLSPKSSSTNVMEVLPKPKSFSIKAGAETRTIAYEDLFVEGHKLWLSRQYAKARPVFQLLASVEDRGPRASILLAHCCAMEQHFSECSRILCIAFPQQSFGKTGAELHDIFVMWSCTFFKEVRKDLENFVNVHPEFPTPALILADLYFLGGRYAESLSYLEKARTRDRKDGSVGMVATLQTEAINKKIQRQQKAVQN